jgi:gas vesicle protein
MKAKKTEVEDTKEELLNEVMRLKRKISKQEILVQALTDENGRLKYRAQMLRKLRDIRVITVQAPDTGKVLRTFTIPAFAMEKNKMLKMDELIGRFYREFGQIVQIELVTVCDTMVDLESEMMAINQTDDGTDLTP